jgi:hypothetical protein
MNKRWAWIWPVLSSLAVTLVTSASQAQGVGMEAMGYAPPPDPAAMAALQQLQSPQVPPAYAQAAPLPVAYPQPGMANPAMFPPGMMPMGMPPQAMMMPPGMPPPGMMPPGVYPANYMGGAAPEAFLGPMPQAPTPMPDAYGAYGSVPRDYGMMGPEMPMDGFCPYCGGAGCDACGGGRRRGLHNGLLGDFFGIVCPYSDGGCAAIRWYDFSIEYMALKRDDTGRNVATTSLGIGGPIVLETDDLDFDNYESSFRFSGVIQVGPGSNIEFTYFGLFNYTDSAFVRRTGDNDLFSAYSVFGTIPPGGFPETDFSDYQQIVYQSTFDSFELNYRQRWMAANCRFQGSWLCGVRHFILDEKFTYFTSSSANGFDPEDPLIPDPLNPAQSRTVVDVTNALTGLQIGGDLWVCLFPGLRLGGELKAGVFGNHMNANTIIGVNTGADPFVENLDGNDVSFVGEANILATYRLNDQWTLRGGYNFVFVDGVALAPENFNPVPPFGPLTRTPFINDNGNVFYHGWNAGLEFMW